jgi:phage gpG-like protein
MATIADLRRKISTAIYNIKTQIPAKVAESMAGETRLNFEREEYGNDGTPRKWADRWGKNLKSKRFENLESYLRYPKLRHRGRLARSITPFYGRGFAGLRAAAPYAELQNTGKGTRTGGNSFRTRPSSSTPVRLGTNPVARPFMGVGQRTELNTLRLYSREIAKLV